MELERLIAALADPACYPGAPPVKVMQTHASVVFLAGDRAYKLKKPVNFGFLDYSTLARRRVMCLREVRLNQRLAPDVYLGVRPVVERDGVIALGGTGQLVDWLVEMRRLPDERCLRHLVVERQVGEEEIRAIARRLAAFYAAPATARGAARYGSIAAIRGNAEENFRQIVPFVGTALSAAAYEEIVATGRALLRERHAIFEARRAAGKVRDGHGDLRCEHVYLLPEIAVVDCIEFNQRFRFGDQAGDLAFLAMDLEAHGRPDLAGALVAEFERAAEDDLSGVLDFFVAYRACVRGKVAALRAAEPEVGDEERSWALVEAARFFALARRVGRGDRAPRLIMICGLTGVGKSVLAQAVGRILGARVFEADETRKRLAGLEPTAHRDDALDDGLYAPAMNARVYAALLEGAAAELAAGRTAILDATYRRRADRAAAVALARKFGARLVVVECVADDATCLARIARRREDPGRHSDSRAEIYFAQRAAFEPLDELPDRLTIDTRLPLARQALAVVEAAG
ncbi:MAG: AAA family ATPase [Chloroflexota bacterium]|nr:AAA family ATPase [Dehalococcoidia bacterium]MDW8255343.1 AAA family ATPase [Chloroflexota bacterium]